MDSAFAEAMRALGPPPQRLDITSAAHYRAVTDEALQSLLDFPASAAITESRHLVPGYDGVEVEVYRFTSSGKSQSPNKEPAILHLHGGGLVAGALATVTMPTARKVAAESGLQVFSVEYRLAIEHPYPTPLEDCFSALQWLSTHAEEFNVDASRIGVVGQSSGGCLTAALCVLARDRGFSPPIARQIMVYPMLDDTTPSLVNAGDTRGHRILNNPSLKSAALGIKFCWAAYLSHEQNPGDVGYAVPARVTDLSNLPPAYIDVGSLDLFRDESIAYALRLIDHGVDCELHVYDGVPHVFELLAPNIPLTLNARANRLRTLQKI